MKLSILGSCSGTEPFENRHHTAFALELGDRIFWFDAGETCSHTAHLMGLDLLRVSDIFISHPHMDHVGGLANLLWTIRKLSKVKKEQPRYGDLHVYIPSEKTWNGILAVLEESEGGYKNDYQTLSHPIFDGVLLENSEIRVTAMHNLHLKEPADGVWRSFSYLIEAEGKRIVFSGDVNDLSELSPWLCHGCDLLLMGRGIIIPIRFVSVWLMKATKSERLDFCTTGGIFSTVTMKCWRPAERSSPTLSFLRIGIRWSSKEDRYEAS